MPTYEAVNIKIAAEPGETLNYNQAEVALNRQLCFNNKAKQSKTKQQTYSANAAIVSHYGPFKKKKVYIRFISES